MTKRLSTERDFSRIYPAKNEDAMSLPCSYYTNKPKRTEIKIQKIDQMPADFKPIGLSSLCPKKSIPSEIRTKIAKTAIVCRGNPKCSIALPKIWVQNSDGILRYENKYWVNDLARF